MKMHHVYNNKAQHKHALKQNDTPYSFILIIIRIRRLSPSTPPPPPLRLPSSTKIPSLRPLTPAPGRKIIANGNELTIDSPRNCRDLLPMRPDERRPRLVDRDGIFQPSRWTGSYCRVRTAEVLLRMVLRGGGKEAGSGTLVAWVCFSGWLLLLF